MADSVAEVAQHALELQKRVFSAADETDPVFGELRAAGWADALRLLDVLSQEEAPQESRRAAAKVLTFVSGVFPELYRLVAEAGVLERWVYVDLQRDDVEQAEVALRYLASLCSTCVPLPEGERLKLGRNLVRLLLDVALDTADDTPPPGDSVPSLCLASLRALLGLAAQLDLFAQSESMGRVVEGLVAHPLAPSGRIGQLLVALLNWHSADSVFGELALRLAGDLLSRGAAARTVLYDSDISVLLGVLSRLIEDTPQLLGKGVLCALSGAVQGRVWKEQADIARAAAALHNAMAVTEAEQAPGWEALYASSKQLLASLHEYDLSQQ